MFRQIGALIARLHEALTGFDAAGITSSPWDLSHFADLAPLVLDAPLDDPAVDSRLGATLDHLSDHGFRLLAALPAQTLHNDLNPHNVLTNDRRICGVIDFGDLAYAPRVQDVAIAASYHICGTEDPLGDVAAVVAGYREGLALSDEEVHALWDLMVARLLSVLGISRWRARRDPSNSAYLMRNNRRASEALRTLLDLGCGRTGARLFEGLG